jgi:hypothetical protein
MRIHAIAAAAIERVAGAGDPATRPNFFSQRCGVRRRRRSVETRRSCGG